MENKKSSKNQISIIKGMQDITDESYYYLQGFFEKAQEIAVYYGFKPIETPIIEDENLFEHSIGSDSEIIEKETYSLKSKGGDRLVLRPEHTSGIMRSYLEKGMASLPQPLLFYSYGPIFRYHNQDKGELSQFFQFDMDAIGSDKPILDALIIKTAFTILEEAGAKNLTVEINSIGDKECRNLYMKELVSFYKKNISHLSASDRDRLKTNPLRILDSKDPKIIELNQGAPDSLSHLCSNCKKHFKEVLEYLEEMEIPYSINKNLVSGLSYYSRTVFEITEETPNKDEKVVVAKGGRYDNLAKLVGSKKDIPAVGISLETNRIVESSWYAKLSPRIIKKPKIYFIQLGFEAKLKSLNVIEILRKGKVPIAQSISKDNLSSQLILAEKLGMEYAIIFGQKEALENTVIFRDMNSRSQETIKISKLLDYIKSIK